MSGTYRHGRVYCQMADCRNRMTRAVKLELPASWSDASEYTVRSVLVGVCGDCARDLDSRARALTGARAEFSRLLTAIEEAAGREAELSAALRQAVELIGSRLDLRGSGVYAGLRAALDQPVATRRPWRLDGPSGLSGPDPGGSAA
jgi:hypothetical protein